MLERLVSGPVVGPVRRVLRRNVRCYGHLLMAPSLLSLLQIAESVTGTRSGAATSPAGEFSSTDPCYQNAVSRRLRSEEAALVVSELETGSRSRLRCSFPSRTTGKGMPMDGNPEVLSTRSATRFPVVPCLVATRKPGNDGAWSLGEPRLGRRTYAWSFETTGPAPKTLKVCRSDD